MLGYVPSLLPVSKIDSADRMKIITDILKIEKLAAALEDENWQFRNFLKGLDIEIEDLDAIVHRLCKEVTQKIDCQTCGNCCRVIHPILRQSDIKRLASHLAISQDEFENQYLIKDEGDNFTFRSNPCPFLSDNSCSVYKNRPEDCKSYPHLHKKEFIFRLIGVVSNCSICPIVFNVYELLKDELQDEYENSFFDDYEYE